MDPQARRQTLRLLSNGMYIVTARDGARYGAATVTWISQASFRPPLLMAAIRPDSSVFRCLAASGTAAIHVLACEQQDLAEEFFRPTRFAGGRLNGEPVTDGITGAPILARLPAYVECAVRRIVETGGDHAIVVLEVTEACCRSPVLPLTVAGSPWRYGG